MHRELVSNAYTLDSIDRSRLTRIAMKAGPPTAKDIRWMERKHTEAKMQRKIDEESERQLLQAHTDLLNCRTREEAIAIDYKEAKNATATAQYRLNKILAEAKDPGLFVKGESND